MTQKGTDQKRGFTLIELLIVMAIVAIFAALLFPVFATARTQAKKTQCLSNLRQLGAGVALYAQDYDSRYAGGMDSAVGSANVEVGLEPEQAERMLHFPVLRDLLRPYLAAADVWRCPSDFGREDRIFMNTKFEMVTVSLRPTAYGAIGTSYAYRLKYALANVIHPANCVTRRRVYPPAENVLFEELRG